MKKEDLNQFEEQAESIFDNGSKGDDIEALKLAMANKGISPAKLLTILSKADGTYLKDFDSKKSKK